MGEEEGRLSCKPIPQPMSSLSMALKKPLQIGVKWQTKAVVAPCLSQDKIMCMAKFNMLCYKVSKQLCHKIIIIKNISLLFSTTRTL